MIEITGQIEGIEITGQIEGISLSLIVRHSWKEVIIVSYVKCIASFFVVTFFDQMNISLINIHRNKIYGSFWSGFVSDSFHKYSSWTVKSHRYMYLCFYGLDVLLRCKTYIEIVILDIEVVQQTVNKVAF